MKDKTTDKYICKAQYIPRIMHIDKGTISVWHCVWWYGLVSPTFMIPYPSGLLNTLRLRQNIWHFIEDSLKCIFLNKNVWISIKISLKYVPLGLIVNIAALVQIMATSHYLNQYWYVVLTHICITRPQWVIWHWDNDKISPVPEQLPWRMGIHWSIEKWVETIIQPKQYKTRQDCVQI